MRKVVVTADRLNVRSGPDTTFDILDVVAQDDVLNVVETAGWTPIEMDDGSLGWVSAKYVADYVEPAPEPEPVPAVKPIPLIPGQDPPWISWAKAQLGEAEAPGAKDNPAIVAWFKESSLPQSLWHDSTAWCAVFLCAAFALTGQPHLHSALAADWLKFGTPVEKPQLGDVVVFQWEKGSHHVALFLEDLGFGEWIKCIGGNQSDAVTIAEYRAEYVLGYRRP